MDMNALVYTAPGKVELEPVPRPEIGSRGVLVNVNVAGICGSDVHGFLGQSRIRKPPAIMGHEFVGTVAEVGNEVRSLNPGQRVVVQPLVHCGHCRWCREGRTNICPNRRLIGAHLPGGFAQYVAVPAENVYPVPDTLTDEIAALVEPCANAVHMMRQAPVRLGDHLVVLGCGTLGLLTIAAARLAGAASIFATDTQAERREQALAAGATLALEARAPDLADQIRSETKGGADVVIEAVGIEATRRTAIEVAAPGGTVVLLGNAEADSSLPVLDLVNRELLVRGSYASTHEDFLEAIRLLSSGAIDTSGWIERARLAEGQAAFERLVKGRDTPVKVLFDLR